jgi:HTH-type transcriptional regulator / antitoxin HigA
MTDISSILNEREARNARATLLELDRALASEQGFESIVAGLPPEVVNGYRQALASRKADTQSHLDAYEAAKRGDDAHLKRYAGHDPAIALIVARIGRGYSQKELARRLGLKEQQIQRYEAERYRSISLSNYRRIAHILGVQWEMKISNDAALFGSGWNIAPHIQPTELRRIIIHAKAHGWFDDPPSEVDETESYNYLQRYISDPIVNHGSPTLLRAGMNIQDYSDDLLLIAWKSRITRVAERIITNKTKDYDGIGITWLLDLVRLSRHDDGPKRARDFLLKQGIVVVVEPPIAGLKLDGAAFLIGTTPVIGMTLRRDTIDNFWFTLLHEVGHVILHYYAGLHAGFFDDIENKNISEVEEEANRFASNLLIAEEKWKRSPARIAKSPEVIVKFAEDIGIHPAIVFGRLQMERRDYATFSGRIGRGLVRKWLLEG